MQRRTLAELVDLREPGIDFVRDLARGAPHKVEVLTHDPSAGEAAIVTLQITTRSPMGAIAYETGGILVDNGWLRILGAGSRRLPRSITEWNRVAEPIERHRLPGTVLVGDDVLGGFFAVNGGGLGANPGNVFYFDPGALAWTDLGGGFSDWLAFVFSAELASFYAPSRWPGWEAEVAALGGDRALSVYPFLATNGPPIAERHRGPVPIEELWSFFVR